jgi:hypothetical protein
VVVVAAVQVQRRIAVEDGDAASEVGQRCADSQEFGDHLRWFERLRRLLLP